VIAERDTQLTGDVLADNMFGDDDEPDDEEMTVTLGDDDVAHGTLVLNPDGTFTYDPDAGYLGIDTFSYVVSDPGGLTDTQTVTIEVESTDAGASGRVTSFSAMPRSEPVDVKQVWEAPLRLATSMATVSMTCCSAPTAETPFSFMANPMQAATALSLSVSRAAL
jgi:VCBS repeat-containing protein